MNCFEAKELLEKYGFVVSPVLAKPDRKYQTKSVNEVVDMIPLPIKLNKTAKTGSLIKIYYVDEKTILQSKDILDIPDVIGMNLNEAKELVLSEGFKVNAVVADANKKYEELAIDEVVDADPKPNMISKHAKRDSIIKLYYVDENAIEKSIILANEAREKVENRNKIIADAASGVKNIFKK